jgi:hypothetical protein
MHVLRSSFLLLFLAVIGFSAEAQRGLKNQPNYDKKRLHFGFNIGLNYWDFNLEPIRDLAALQGYYSVRSEVQPGYNIGIVSNLRLSDHFDFRILPSFASTERILYFTVDDNTTGRVVEIERKIQSSFIEVPFLLKFKSERVGNYRMYVLGGGKYNLDLASKKDVLDDRFFKINNTDLSYELGFGIDFYFEFFKFSPQIKASWGFADMLIQDDTFFVDGITRLESRALLISLNFE